MELQEAFDAGLEAVKRYVDKRFAEIEAKTMRYEGVWQRAQDYTKGALVTSDGSAWVALKAVSPGGDKPGNGGAWHLVFKSGVSK